MRVVSTGWIKGSFGQFADASCLMLHKQFTKASPETPLIVLMLEGFDLTPPRVIGELRESHIILEDVQQLTHEVSHDFAPLRAYLPPGAPGDYEFLCFIRWLIIDRVLSGDQFLQMDLDLFFQLPLKDIVALFSDRCGTFASPCMTSVGSRQWVETYKDALKELMAAPESFHTKINYIGTPHRRLIGSDQDLVQALERCDQLPVTVHHLHNDYAIFNNPLYPILPNEPAPMFFERYDNMDYMAGKLVLFWHFQNDFSKYLGRFQFVERIARQAGRPLKGRIDNPVENASSSQNFAFEGVEQMARSLAYGVLDTNLPTKLLDCISRLKRTDIAHAFLVQGESRDLFSDDYWWEPGRFEALSERRTAFAQRKLINGQEPQVDFRSQQRSDSGGAAGKLAASKEFYWYHCIDLGDGVITNGDYDINDFIDAYRFPEDMSGLDVLDVGCASGAFSFEFERRGANVYAVDLRSALDWDFLGGDLSRQEAEQRYGSIEDFSRHSIWGAFQYARQVRKSNINFRFCNVYDLSPARFGGKAFDITFFGSVTSCLRDPNKAAQCLRKVTKPGGVCIVGAPYLHINGYDSTPIMALVGSSADSDRRSWWVINELMLKEMLIAARFDEVDIISQFTLQHRRQSGARYPHVVAHGRVRKGN
jgi:tRNA (mo5U34)-methyltransferase